MPEELVRDERGSAMSRWSIHFEGGHQPVAGLLETSLVSQWMKEQKAHQMPS